MARGMDGLRMWESVALSPCRDGKTRGKKKYVRFSCWLGYFAFKLGAFLVRVPKECGAQHLVAASACANQQRL